MQLRRLLITILSSFIILADASAQDMTVRSMEPLPMDTYASIHKRLDLNGNACAVVRVSLTVSGATFSGNVVGDVARDGSDYLVYMPQGSKKLWVKHPNYHELEVTFGDYGIDRLQGLTTYRVTVNAPQLIGVQQDNGLTYFILSVQPKNAQVTIDGNQQPLDPNGEYSVLLPRTTHTYTVSAGGYAPKTETFTLGSERKSVSVSLESNMATLSISTATSGAAIYVNEQRKGTGTWSGQLLPGNYSIEARLDGYYPRSETVSLSARQQHSVTIPALVARTGSLDISYKPINSEVWIDGKKAGMSPDVFNGIVVGSHKVSIRKDGYQTKEFTVTVSEGQTQSLTGMLEQGTLSTYTASSTISGAQTFTVNGVSFTMIPVEGGTFTMGATPEMTEPYKDEEPTHQVTLSSYYIGETEVTQELWQAVMGSNPSQFKGSRNPVEQVCWDDCQTFIKNLNQATGKNFRLPTEAEWEFAARGGNKSRHTQYSGSSNIDEVAWYSNNSCNKGTSSPDYGTHPVKQKKANELGIYDMTGNVLEWCQDRYGDYSSSTQTNPTGPSSGSDRVRRGGCWYVYARDCRVSIRYDWAPVRRSNYLGLRLVLSE